MIADVPNALQKLKLELLTTFEIFVLNCAKLAPAKLTGLIEGKYIEYVLLFSILILGQNVVSYNVQNELRLVKKGFPLRYSLKEK